MRATQSSLAEAQDSAADLVGALDLVEATLGLLAAGSPGSDAPTEPRGEPSPDLATLSRRAAAVRSK